MNVPKVKIVYIERRRNKNKKKKTQVDPLNQPTTGNRHIPKKKLLKNTYSKPDSTDILYRPKEPPSDNQDHYRQTQASNMHARCISDLDYDSTHRSDQTSRIELNRPPMQSDIDQADRSIRGAYDTRDDVNDDDNHRGIMNRPKQAVPVKYQPSKTKNHQPAKKKISDLKQSKADVSAVGKSKASHQANNCQYVVKDLKIKQTTNQVDSIKKIEKEKRKKSVYREKTKKSNTNQSEYVVKTER